MRHLQEGSHHQDQGKRLGQVLEELQDMSREENCFKAQEGFSDAIFHS
jgi:hypothetical protein